MYRSAVDISEGKGHFLRFEREDISTSMCCKKGRCKGVPNSLSGGTCMLRLEIVGSLLFLLIRQAELDLAS